VYGYFAIAICHGVFALFTMYCRRFSDAVANHGAGFCYKHPAELLPGLGTVVFRPLRQVGDYRLAICYAGFLFFARGGKSPVPAGKRRKECNKKGYRLKYKPIFSCPRVWINYIRFTGARPASGFAEPFRDALWMHHVPWEVSHDRRSEIAALCLLLWPAVEARASAPTGIYLLARRSNGPAGSRSHSGSSRWRVS